MEGGTFTLRSENHQGCKKLKTHTQTNKQVRGAGKLQGETQSFADKQSQQNKAWRSSYPVVEWREHPLSYTGAHLFAHYFFLAHFCPEERSLAGFRTCLPAKHSFCLLWLNPQFTLLFKASYAEYLILTWQFFSFHPLRILFYYGLFTLASKKFVSSVVVSL